MDVHVRKCHKEEVECGLCDCTHENRKNLENHQVTCEVYQYGKTAFGEKVKTISDIKKHILEVHGHPTQVVHLTSRTLHKLRKFL